jgi:hypothetical protein
MYQNEKYTITPKNYAVIDLPHFTINATLELGGMPSANKRSNATTIQPHASFLNK